MTDQHSPSASGLLNAGIMAGPLFIGVSLLLAFTREGFDPVRHPASLLSLGDGGWMQIATFVLSGILYIAAGVGLGRTLTSGIGRTWVPRLFVVLGIALIMGGVFVADPALGFPPGAPQGSPPELSWHGTLHAFAPPLGFFSLFAALIILGRRFGSMNRNSWRWTSYVVALGTLVLTSLPNFTANWETGEFNFIPLWIGVAIAYGYTSLVLGTLKPTSDSAVGRSEEPA